MITAMKSESFSTRRYQYKDKRRSGAAALPNFCNYLIFEIASCAHTRNTIIYGAAVYTRACV